MKWNSGLDEPEKKVAYVKRKKAKEEDEENEDENEENEEPKKPVVIFGVSKKKTESWITSMGLQTVSAL